MVSPSWRGRAFGVWRRSRASGRDEVSGSDRRSGFARDVAIEYRARPFARQRESNGPGASVVHTPDPRRRMRVRSRAGAAIGRLRGGLGRSPAGVVAAHKTASLTWRLTRAQRARRGGPTSRPRPIPRSTTLDEPSAGRRRPRCRPRCAQAKTGSRTRRRNGPSMRLIPGPRAAPASRPGPPAARTPVDASRCISERGPGRSAPRCPRVRNGSHMARPKGRTEGVIGRARDRGEGRIHVTRPSPGRATFRPPRAPRPSRGTS
jgi:hypothetical protein